MSNPAKSMAAKYAHTFASVEMFELRFLNIDAHSIAFLRKQKNTISDIFLSVLLHLVMLTMERVYGGHN